MTGSRAGVAAGVAALVATLLAGAAPAGEAELAGAARVLDGDTLDIGPVRVRVHGIDAPEFSQTCAAAGGSEWTCGKAAAARLGALIRDRRVVCDPRERDQYGRIVARCEAGGVDLGGALVAEGLAWAFVRYSDDYEATEAAARAAGLGIWQAETMTAWDWRATAWRDAAGNAADDAPGDCPIKGNISRSGERIYHTPWSRDYAKVRIDEGLGERWFCDEAEAQAAGWRPPR
ncbi:thermonuclease family protein [Amaricoccus sp.]|uniref:thermonuclease family protein n=1 Tax=Amaricoccus sp. TaxID=1872485 RepID=UPI001B4E178D|nr:thermonuclease family protein [Amaricoccus sp.]MBP7242751.1 thermonuclease family protein [Amaricoccus sp.]